MRKLINYWDNLSDEDVVFFCDKVNLLIALFALAATALLSEPANGLFNPANFL